MFLGNLCSIFQNAVKTLKTAFLSPRLPCPRDVARLSCPLLMPDSTSSDGRERFYSKKTDLVAEEALQLNHLHNPSADYQAGTLYKKPFHRSFHEYWGMCRVHWGTAKIWRQINASKNQQELIETTIMGLLWSKCWACASVSGRSTWKRWSTTLRWEIKT